MAQKLSKWPCPANVVFGPVVAECGGQRDYAVLYTARFLSVSIRQVGKAQLRIDGSKFFKLGAAKYKPLAFVLHVGPDTTEMGHFIFFMYYQDTWVEINDGRIKVHGQSFVSCHVHQILFVDQGDNAITEITTTDPSITFVSSETCSEVIHQAEVQAVRALSAGMMFSEVPVEDEELCSVYSMSTATTDKIPEDEEMPTQDRPRKRGNDGSNAPGTMARVRFSCPNLKQMNRPGLPRVGLGAIFTNPVLTLLQLE